MGKWEKRVAIQACPRENVLQMTTSSGLHVSIKNLLQIFHNYAYWFESWQSSQLKYVFPFSRMVESVCSCVLRDKLVRFTSYYCQT